MFDDLPSTIEDLFNGHYRNYNIHIVVILIFSFVFMYFVYSTLFGFLFGLKAYTSRLNENARVTYYEAEAFILQKYPNLAKDVDKLLEHGFPEEARNVVLKKLKDV